MPSAVVVEIRPQHSVTRPALAVAATVAAAIVIWLVLGLIGSPSMIPRVTVSNPSSGDLEIDVAPVRGGATLDLGHVAPRSSRTIQDVLDQGDTWVFTVSSARARLGTFPVDRDELADNDWTITLPADLTDGTA